MSIQPWPLFGRIKIEDPLVHVEADLRNFDRTIPEEINRSVTYAISDLLLVTGESGAKICSGKPSTWITFTWSET